MKKIQLLSTFLSKNQKILLLVLTCILGIFILAPYANFQPILAQGDHGRDLYAFRSTLEGSTPYEDYWWVYGPAMPYYYASAYKILGISIQSILIAKIFLILIAGILFYLTISLFASPMMAMAATVWFLAFRPEFFYTYNHTGAIPFFILTMFFIAHYIQSCQKKFIYATLLSISTIFLIKANMGFFFLLSTLITFALTDYIKEKKIQNKKIYILSLLGIPALAFLIYWLLTRNLPIYFIKQCFPYLPSYDPTHASIWMSLVKLWRVVLWNITSWSLPNRIFAIIIFLCGFRSIQAMLKNSQENKTKEFFLFLISLILFIFFGLHEFFASAIVYRMRWVNPFQMLFIFLIIEYAIKNLSKVIRFSIYIIFLIVALTSAVQQHKIVALYKNNNHLLQINKTKVYIENPPSWINTVTSSVDYLKKNVNKDETFLALPYDSLYYFLTNKKSPTRELIFFDYINIPQEQERAIISDLKENNAAYIVLSSRSDSKEAGLGTFGKTYCPVLKKYIDENFTAVETFGNWGNEPGWAWYHAVKILKRKENK
ncbi:MAG: hypothetical protein PHY73_00800 [Candidatus Omnitrophica bacterium]|nr:hypothetical protein [Candidatus Omnitrophota bacterium]